MPHKDIIVIGTSDGGIDALRTLIRELPPDFPASLFVVLHMGAHGLGILPDILNRVGRLPASNARDWDAIERGRIYVAPPDRHLILEPSGYVRITRGPKENRFRPAVDPLFRSAAAAFGDRVIGVILTGWLSDGTAGLWAVKECGGIAIVQDPDDALAPSMPLSALEHVSVDHRVPLVEIAPLLVRLVRSHLPEKGEPLVPTRMQTEVDIAKEDKAFEVGINDWGEPSVYACPECHGVLRQLVEGTNLRFRCHTGHAYSVEALLSEFTDKTEDTLWSAIRSMQETHLLLQRMAAQLRDHQHAAAADRLLAKAQETLERADLVRKAVMTHQKLDGDGGPSADGSA